MPDPTFEIDGRRTGRGAFTDAIVIRPDGSKYTPDCTETSKSGNHWTKLWYEPLEDCLILITDFSNSGKDNSSIGQVPKDLTPEQQEALATFKAKHYLD